MKAHFIKSALKDVDWPELKDPNGKHLHEVAVVGRSNAGKSSLLNHVFQHKRLAKVSSRPGKTQLLNFFSIDDAFVLVDCPGYGFAKVPKKLQREWGQWVEEYLTTRPQLSLILFLLDIRRKPSEEDLMFFQWAKHHQKPIQLILTKIDKIKVRERKKHVSTILKVLEDEDIHIDSRPLLYTVKSSEGRTLLLKKLESHHKEWHDSTP